MDSKGILYIVSTPIGNLQDITLRALEILKSADLILCEDTRRSGILLANYQIKKPLLSYQEFNEMQRIPEIINRLNQGQNIALISDAGTPTISDPGFKLVREAIHQGSQVVSIPGASSILTALTSSGLPTDKFLFLGYLPKKPGHRQKLLHDLTTMIHIIRVTVIFFEAPHRFSKTLQELMEVFGDIEIVICRELTKVHEEIRREKISEATKHFGQVAPKGEFTILINFVQG
ncbi:16S rRNA (cytidine(1402)-2'-O)-methyltransferase [Candidatus Microgenomates bacterium]|nr:16S rRNA (cytidine(1402)-2'-O)-methyltransferase [Candidatus Microgenomates bacterium]